MNKDILVHKDNKPCYHIVISNSFDSFGEEVIKARESVKRICIVTDSNVAPLYLQKIKEICSSIADRVESFIFNAGEQNKNLYVVKDLYEFLIEKEFDRQDILVALGGGVVGDLTGFTAATYLRGIDFIQVPTTLLSQVDSSIGGKTGVDFDAYKNMVGAFKMPKLVYINVSTLLSLPAEQFSSGMGEVIKYGCISDYDYFTWLEENIDSVKARDLETLSQLVYISCENKRKVVEEDPTEKGLRAILNYGHTIGHAIEKESNFSLFHGQCVGVGMVAASWLSVQKGCISSDDLKRIILLLKAYDIPVKASGINKQSVLEAMKHDKKMSAGTLKFILIKKIGEAYIDKTLSFDDFEAAISYVLDED